MKNKELVVEKIERLQNCLKTLEFHLKTKNLQGALSTIPLLQQHVETVYEQIQIQSNN